LPLPNTEKYQNHFTPKQTEHKRQLAEYIGNVIFQPFLGHFFSKLSFDTSVEATFLFEFFAQ
jgi:hypothetical protein